MLCKRNVCIKSRVIYLGDRSNELKCINSICQRLCCCVNYRLLVAGACIESLIKCFLQYCPAFGSIVCTIKLLCVLDQYVKFRVIYLRRTGILKELKGCKEFAKICIKCKAVSSHKVNAERSVNEVLINGICICSGIKPLADRRCGTGYVYSTNCHRNYLCERINSSFKRRRILNVMHIKAKVLDHSREAIGSLEIFNCGYDLSNGELVERSGEVRHIISLEVSLKTCNEICVSRSTKAICYHYAKHNCILRILREVESDCCIKTDCKLKFLSADAICLIEVNININSFYKDIEYIGNALLVSIATNNNEVKIADKAMLGANAYGDGIILLNVINGEVPRTLLELIREDGSFSSVCNVLIKNFLNSTELYRVGNESVKESYESLTVSHTHGLVENILNLVRARVQTYDIINGKLKYLVIINVELVSRNTVNEHLYQCVNHKSFYVGYFSCSEYTCVKLNGNVAHIISDYIDEFVMNYTVCILRISVRNECGYVVIVSTAGNLNISGDLSVNNAVFSFIYITINNSYTALTYDVTVDGLTVKVKNCGSIEYQIIIDLFKNKYNTGATHGGKLGRQVFYKTELVDQTCTAYIEIECLVILVKIDQRSRECKLDTGILLCDHSAELTHFETVNKLRKADCNISIVCRINCIIAVLGIFEEVSKILECIIIFAEVDIISKLSKSIGNAGRRSIAFHQRTNNVHNKSYSNIFVDSVNVCNINVIGCYEKCKVRLICLLRHGHTNMHRSVYAFKREIISKLICEEISQLSKVGRSTSERNVHRDSIINIIGRVTENESGICELTTCSSHLLIRDSSAGKLHIIYITVFVNKAD